jgi:hypothetical protein
MTAENEYGMFPSLLKPLNAKLLQSHLVITLENVPLKHLAALSRSVPEAPLGTQPEN